MRRVLGAIAPGSWLSLESTRARHDRGYTQLDKRFHRSTTRTTPTRRTSLENPWTPLRLYIPQLWGVQWRYLVSCLATWTRSTPRSRRHDGTSADRAASQEAATPQRCNCLSGGNAEKPVKRTYQSVSPPPFNEHEATIERQMWIRLSAPMPTVLDGNVSYCYIYMGLPREQWESCTDCSDATGYTRNDGWVCTTVRFYDGYNTGQSHTTA